MPDELSLKTRLPLIAAAVFALLALLIAGNVLIVAADGPLALTVIQWLGMPIYLLFGLSVLTQHRHPVRISADGLMQRTVTWHRYDTFVPWSQVERMWFQRAGWLPVILVTLRNPAAVAGPNHLLALQMRTLRRKRGADLAIPLLLTRTGRDLIAGAISFHSHGRIQVADRRPVNRFP